MRLTEEEYARMMDKSQPRTKTQPAASIARESYSLVLPLAPSVNHLYATVVIKGRARRIITKVGREYKLKAAEIARRQGAKKLDGNLSIVIRVYRARKVGDLDNFQKATFDSLKGICWEDDSQIVAIHAYRFDDKLNPRIELEVRNI